MFYSFYLFLSILLCNVDSASVSDSNAYIWISNCIQIFELYSNVQIYIASSDDVGKKMLIRKDSCVEKDK